MEEAEFSRKWADLKSSEEEKKFLMAQFNKLLGPIDGFKRRLPNIPNGVLLISKDKFAKMAANSQNARGSNNRHSSGSHRSAKNEGVREQPDLGKIVEEMTSVPSLIDAMDPLIVQRFKMQPPPPPPPPPRTKRPSDTKSPEETPTKVIKTETVQKAPPKVQPSPVDVKPVVPLKVPKSKETTLKASNHNASNAQSERPTPKPASNSIKPYINSNSARRGTSKERPPVEKMEPTTSADPSGGLDRSSQRRPNSTQGSRPSSVAQASTSASPAPKRKSSPTNAVPRPSSRRSNESKRELVPCKMPQYALGEFCGYKAKIKGDKQNSRLPEMVVSLNIAKMSTLEEIMARVKAIVTKPPRAAGEVKIADLNRALCCCGLMLYAVCQAPPDGVNDLLREVMAMLRVFRTTYFMDSPQCQKLTNFTPTSAFLYLADSFLCERLYENTMDAARIRRMFMEEHRSVFSNVGENEVLSTQNLTALLDMKDRATVKEMLKDVVVNDAVNVPKLQLQILLETSQHAMLHERHVYAKSLAEELMVGSQKELWHRLVKDMKIRLDATSVTIPRNFMKLLNGRKRSRKKTSRSSLSMSSRRQVSSRDIATSSRMPSDSDLSLMSEAELNERLQPHLASLNVDGSKFNTMQRKAKEEILKQCERRPSFNAPKKPGQDPVDIAQRFMKLSSPSVAQNCSAMVKELKDLRIFVQSENLDWLKSFCEVGGASALMNIIDRICNLVEVNLSSQPPPYDASILASIILEHIKCVRALLNNQCGRRYCCGPSMKMCAKLVNLLRICNKTLDRSYDNAKEDLFAFLLVIMLMEEEATGHVSGFKLIMEAIETVAKEHRQPRFHILAKCLECEALTLPTLRFITMMFDQLDEQDWKLRTLWRGDLWTAGFDKHYERLCSANPKGELHELLTRISDQWKVDAQKLNEKCLELSQEIDLPELFAKCEQSFNEDQCGFVWKDILIRLLILSSTSNDTYKHAISVRHFISELTFFGDDFNRDYQTQQRFSNDLFSLSASNDMVHMRARLQKAVDEKQQVNSLQGVYSSNLAQLQAENEQLRAHIANPALPLPEKSKINVELLKHSAPSAAPIVPVGGPPKIAAPPPPPPPPSAASLRPTGGPPMPAGVVPKVGGGPPPPPPPPSAASLRPGGKVPPPPGPPPPLGAGFASVKIAPNLPSHLQPKNDAMTDVATRKIAGWEDARLQPRTIKDNSIWTNFTEAERDYAVNTLYNLLKETFARPQVQKSVNAFTRKVVEPVILTDEKLLKSWEILAARKITDVQAFKAALLQVNLDVLVEDTLELILNAMLEPVLLTKLRETPIEKFANAPYGEKVVATLSHIKDLPNRLRSIYLLLTFETTVEELRSNASTIAEACDEIRQSVGLGMFATLVLVCGNYMMRTPASRQLCYGYLMRLLPKLNETKDAKNDLTLLEHLICIFDAATNRKFAEFPHKDFIQVERAKRLIVSDVLISIDGLNAQVKRIVAYHKSFVKQSEDDALSSILDKALPGYLAEVENLLCLKKSVESKAAEIERYFSFDSKPDSKNHYTLEDLFRDIFFFSTLYKAAYEKMAKAAEQSKKKVTAPPKVKQQKPVKERPLLQSSNPNDNLFERLEQTLVTNAYRVAKTPRRGSSGEGKKVPVKRPSENTPPQPSSIQQQNKENARPRSRKSKAAAADDLDSLCRKVQEL